jgi:hypothetical protein
MSNIFDHMQDGLFDLTTATFGYEASWTPSLGGSIQTGRVNYRRPNEKDALTNGMDYMPFVFFMEYKEGVFNGLQDAVRSGNTEAVTINGQAHYVRSVNRVYDGKTFQAHLELIEQ